MSRFAAALHYLLVHHLTPSGRERSRRIRQAETDALVVASRLEVVRLLAAIGEYQLGLAELSRRHAIATQPHLARRSQRVVDSLVIAIRAEIEGFVERGGEVSS